MASLAGLVSICLCASTVHHYTRTSSACACVRERKAWPLHRTHTITTATKSPIGHAHMQSVSTWAAIVVEKSVNNNKSGAMCRCVSAAAQFEWIGQRALCIDDSQFIFRNIRRRRRLNWRHRERNFIDILLGLRFFPQLPSAYGRHTRTLAHRRTTTRYSGSESETKQNNIYYYYGTYITRRRRHSRCRFRLNAD